MQLSGSSRSPRSRCGCPRSKGQAAVSAHIVSLQRPIYNDRFVHCDRADRQEYTKIILAGQRRARHSCPNAVVFSAIGRAPVDARGFRFRQPLPSGELKPIFPKPREVTKGITRCPILVEVISTSNAFSVCSALHSKAGDKDPGQLARAGMTPVGLSDRHAGRSLLVRYRVLAAGARRLLELLAVAVEAGTSGRSSPL